jgi:hypothetical protein
LDQRGHTAVLLLNRSRQIVGADFAH